MALEFSMTYYGNSIMQWAIFLGIILVSIAIGKLVHLVIHQFVHAFASRTKTKIDDILVKSLKRPFIFLLFIIGVYVGHNYLSLSVPAQGIFESIIKAFIIFDIAWILAGLMDGILQHYIMPLTAKTKTDVDEQLLPIVKKLVKFFIFAIAIIVILDNNGINVASLIAGLGLGGLAFALAAKDMLANLFGGAAILADKPFKIGDRIKVDGQDIDGFVSEIGLRTTRVRTFGGTYLIMPNARVADSVIENVSKETARRVKIMLGVEYGTSVRKMEEAKKIVEEILKKNKRTKDESLVNFTDWNDFSLGIMVIYWITDLNDILGVQHEVNMAIKRAFEIAKIEFAFPTQTIHLRK